MVGYTILLVYSSANVFYTEVRPIEIFKALSLLAVSTSNLAWDVSETKTCVQSHLCYLRN